MEASNESLVQKNKMYIYIYIYIYIGKSTKYQYINIWLISKKKKNLYNIIIIFLCLFVIIFVNAPLTPKTVHLNLRFRSQMSIAWITHFYLRGEAVDFCVTFED